jgi:hypothetical protein
MAGEKMLRILKCKRGEDRWWNVGEAARGLETNLHEESNLVGLIEKIKAIKNIKVIETKDEYTIVYKKFLFKKTVMEISKDKTGSGTANVYTYEIRKPNKSITQVYNLLEYNHEIRT